MVKISKVQSSETELQRGVTQILIVATHFAPDYFFHVINNGGSAVDTLIRTLPLSPVPTPVKKVSNKVTIYLHLVTYGAYTEIC